MRPLVIDTCVLVDMFVATRKRHAEAEKLGRFLVDNKISVRVPAFSLYELASALKNEGINYPYKFQKGITEDNPLLIDFIPVDEAFITKYLDESLPYSKAGDLLILSLSKKEDAYLITEDDRLYERAKAAGVQVFRIEEFLNQLAL